MYECCCMKKFLRLIMLDSLIFSICLIFFFIGKNIIFSSGTEREKIFLPVIMYHSIRSGEAQDYAVTPEQLETDLDYLSTNGYNTVTAQQLVDYVYSGGSLPKNPVLITIDDGFYNSLYYLVPLLEKYNMNAIVSVVGSYTDNNAVKDPHVPAYSYLTWDDINELLASGRIEIGNHTYNMHSNTSSRKGCSINSGEDAADYAEIFGSDITLLQTEMHRFTGQSAFVFAYPYGAVCEESIPVLRENGFYITLTCRELSNYISPGTDCLYNLGRYNRSGLYSTEEFMKKVLENENEKGT